MTLLIRKIEKAKWMQNDIAGGEDISADAITNCMKTNKNTLSTWQITEKNQVSEAVLAIVSSHQHLDTIDVVCLERSSIENQGIRLESTPGNTPFRDFAERHIDISKLTYKSLGIVANEIAKEIKNNSVERYTRGNLKKLINAAIAEGRLLRKDLNESLIKNI